MTDKASPSPSCLSGGGTVGALLRAHDWSTSSLGEPGSWPQPLKTLVSLMLHTKTPVFLAWGPDLSALYNDAYTDILGDKHPASLGRPFSEVWAENWADVESLVKRALSGEAFYFENMPFTLQRKGQDEQTWFNFSYSPVYDLIGKVAGLYCSVIETTAQVLAENLRKEETQRLYSLFAQAPSFMAVLHGPGHVFKLANRALLGLVGERDLMGKPFREAFKDIEGQGYGELLDRVYATGEPYAGRRMPVIFAGQADGPPEPRFVDFVLQPMTGPDGVVSGIFMDGFDVTDHVRTEDALQEQKRSALEAAQRLDALLEAAPVGIMLADTDGRLLRVNSAKRHMWGERPLLEGVEKYSDWKGWWADGTHKHGHRLEPHDWAMARALQGEKASRDIVEIEAFDEAGTRRTILNCAAPVHDLDGKITGSVIAQMDITDRVKVEAALRESEAKFRTITNAMPQIVWSALPSGYHDYFNQKFYDYAGVSAREGDGDAWRELLHPDDRERTGKRWRHSLQTGESYEIEFRGHHHSGQYRWNLARALPIRDDKGAIVRWMGTCTDIHEQKLAQEALLEADRRKDEYLAMLAHELRNPLAPITSAAELLSTGSLGPDQVRKMSALISRQASHMAGLLEDLLDVSRVTRGRVSLDKKPVDMTAVVTEAVEQVGPLLNARAHQLELQLPAQSVLVSGDRLRLVQVLTNVLNNAAKYTPHGGHIGLRMTANESQVILAVRDNGMGMCAELVGRAFELFVQGERTLDRSEGGLGVGLALVKSLVSLHGGTVTLQSEGVGLGSEVTIFLPRLPQEDGARRASECGP